MLAYLSIYPARKRLLNHDCDKSDFFMFALHVVIDKE